MELARKTSRESLKFIKGEISIDCTECPVNNLFCSAIDDINEAVGEDVMELICYGAFMKFLFSEV